MSTDPQQPSDTALIVAGVVHQVWREMAAAEVARTHVGLSGELVEFRDPKLVCGMRWDGKNLSPPPPPVIPLEALQDRRIAEAWSICQRRVSGDSIAVKTSAGDLPFGIDDVTRANLQQLMIGIEVMPAGTIANPRPWSPKGLPPMLLSHDDLRAAAIATSTAYDLRMQAYLQHKAQIRALSDPAAVTAYDLASGWPLPGAHYTVDVSGASGPLAALHASVQTVVAALKDLATPAPSLTAAPEIKSP